MNFKLRWARCATWISIAVGLSATYIFDIDPIFSVMLMTITLVLVLIVGALMPENEQATLEMRDRGENE